MEFILFIFSAWICGEVIFLIIYVYVIRMMPNFRKAVKLFPVPQKILSDKLRFTYRRSCFVRDHCGAQNLGQSCRYIFNTTNDGILIRDFAPQQFFIFFPLRLLARTIFLPWNSLSIQEPEKPSKFRLIKRNRVTIRIDGSPIIISMKKKDLVVDTTSSQGHNTFDEAIAPVILSVLIIIIIIFLFGAGWFGIQVIRWLFRY